MSQTSGHSGNDPEKDEWLKQFTGIPDGHDPDDLKNDRPYVDPVMQKRADALSIEGQIEAVGDFAHGIKSRYDPSDEHETKSTARRIGRRLVYTLVMLFIFWIILTASVGF